MTDIRAKEVTLIEDGSPQVFCLRTPTPFAMEQFLRLLLDADLDLNTVVTPYLDPDVALLRLAELEKLPRDKRREPEVKAALAEAKAEVSKVSALSQEQLAAARKSAARHRAQDALDRMVLSSAMLAALLSDASPKVDGRPSRIYSREEASQMLPIDTDAADAVREAVGDLWPTGEATPGNPSAGTETGSPTPTTSTQTS